MANRGRPSKYPDIDNEVKRLYKSKVSLQKINIYEFNQWYKEQNGCCTYCGLTTSESLQLFQRYPETTRGGKRGRSLELDRINPSIRSYGDDIQNLALACYWCNKAKTNYFAFEEFKIIGKTINEIQKQRLRQINEED